MIKDNKSIKKIIFCDNNIKNSQLKVYQNLFKKQNVILKVN